MKKEQFEKEIAKIQKFLNLNDWDISFRFLDNVDFEGELTSVDYSRFLANLSFNKSLLKKGEKYIKMIIMHEMCHIFTISGLRYYEEDEGLRRYVGEACFTAFQRIMNHTNEQMTVRLERLFTEFYK